MSQRAINGAIHQIIIAANDELLFARQSRRRIVTFRGLLFFALP